MTMPHRRRIGSCLAALVLVTGLASGCTAGDWHYDIPSAAGVLADAGPVKARNVMLLADNEGKGLLMGSLFTSEQVELVTVAVAAERSDGSFGEPVGVDVAGNIGVEEMLMLGGQDSIVEGADLQPGMLAAVLLNFSDGTSMSLETPVVSSEDPSYTAAWDEAQG